MGWKYGSDGDELKLGFNFFNKKNLILTTSVGIRRSGEENIINRPFDTYKDYLKGKFPSGINTEIYFIENQIEIWYKPNFNLFSSISINYLNNKILEKDYKVGFDIHIPKFFKL